LDLVEENSCEKAMICDQVKNYTYTPTKKKWGTIALCPTYKSRKQMVEKVK
jgi:hypothetical protein